MSNGGKLKVVMLGSSTVGKTCLVDRFVYSTFSVTRNTVAMAFTPFDIPTDQGNVPVGIWDTAGQERFEATLRQYYREADASLICFNPCEPQTWQKAKFWANELIETVPNCVICLVATKSDLWDPSVAPNPNNLKSRAVSSATARKFAKSISATYFECSSKAGKGVNEPFIHAAQEASTFIAAQPKTKPNTVKLTSSSGDGNSPTITPNEKPCCF